MEDKEATNYYDNLGDLLRAWRKQFGASQEVLSDRIGVSSRELRRWESRGEKQSIPSDENLEDIAEATGIPFAVLLALAARRAMPVFYSLTYRHYSFTPDGLETSIGQLLPRIRNEAHDKTPVVSLCPINREAEVSNVLEYHRSVYPAPKMLDAKVILESSLHLPQLNLYIKDAWGHYAGHIVTLLVSTDCYKKLMAGKMAEADIAVSDLRRIDQPHVIYIFSAYSSHKTVALRMLRHYFLWMRAILRSHGDRTVAGYAVSQDGLEFIKHFKFEVAYVNKTEQQELGMDVSPTMCHGSLKQFVATAFGNVSIDVA